LTSPPDGGYRTSRKGTTTNGEPQVAKDKTWKIRTKKKPNGETRAFCGLPGCYAFRDHAERNTAAQFVMGHMVAKHMREGVNPSDEFEIL